MTDNNKERSLVEIKKLNQIRDEIGPKKRLWVLSFNLIEGWRYYFSSVA